METNSRPLLALVLSVALGAAACSTVPSTTTPSTGPSTTSPSTTVASAQWQATHQETWWYAASIHADNTPDGTPQWARDVWDEIVLIDPEAPVEIRPFWVMKTGGRTPLTDAFYEEIQERTEAGFRVVFTLKDEAATPTDLRAVVQEMADRNALPWGVGLWNELDFGGRNSPEEFAAILTKDDLPGELETLHDDFGVMVSPPGLASFSNIILNGYGEVIRDLFADRRGVFVKVHSYGHVQPKYWVELDLKTRALDVLAMPDTILIIEETANSFVGERQDPKPGVDDEQGAEFMRAAMYAGMQSQMPTAHFMLYHQWSNWNDISDPVHGALRRAVAMEVFEQLRSTNNPAPPGAMDLLDPMGREIDPNHFKP